MPRLKPSLPLHLSQPNPALLGAVSIDNQGKLFAQHSSCPTSPEFSLGRGRRPRSCAYAAGCTNTTSDCPPAKDAATGSVPEPFSVARRALGPEINRKCSSGAPFFQRTRVRHALTRQNAICIDGEGGVLQINRSISKQEGPENISDGEKRSKAVPCAPLPASLMALSKKPKPKKLVLSRTLTPPVPMTSACSQKDVEQMDILEERIIELSSSNSSSEDCSTDSVPVNFPKGSVYRSQQRISDPYSQQPSLSPLVLQSLQVFHWEGSTRSVSDGRRAVEDKAASSVCASNPAIFASAENASSASSDRQQTQPTKQNLLKTVLQPKPPISQPRKQTSR